jgi:hypothetical protein
MKKLIFIVIIACPKWMQGQVFQKYSLETTTGYESNIFKSPDSLSVLNDSVVHYKDELWNNSAFQDFNASLKLGKKWKKQELSIKIEPGFRYYYAFADKSYFDLRSTLNYEYNFNKKFSYVANFKHGYVNRDGTNFDDAELVTPLAYQSLNISNGLQWRFSKENRSMLMVDYENMNYKPSSKTHLLYDKIGAEFETKQFFYDHKLKHTVGLKMGYHNRLYKIAQYKYADSISKRDWRYIDVGAFYSYPISKIAKLTAGIDYQNRIDKTRSLNGYQMFKPSLTLELEGEKFELNSKFSYASRLYTSRTGLEEDFDTGQEPLLQYKYYMFASKGAFKIAKKLYFTTLIDLRIRKTNREKITSRSFRSYQTYELGIGLKYVF